MIYIKKFIDKVSLIESKQSKDLIMNITEARGLRDELAKMLSELHMLSSTKQKEEPTFKVEVRGGSW